MLLMSFVFFCLTQNCKLFVFVIIWPSAYMIKVIPAHRVQYMRYLHVYQWMGNINKYRRLHILLAVCICFGMVLMVVYYAQEFISSFSVVRVTRSLVFCVMLCGSLLVLLSILFWPLWWLSFFDFTDFDYALGIFKLYLCTLLCLTVYSFSFLLMFVIFILLCWFIASPLTYSWF
jgi:hypothetical protein